MHFERSLGTNGHLHPDAPSTVDEAKDASDRLYRLFMVVLATIGAEAGIAGLIALA